MFRPGFGRRRCGSPGPEVRSSARSTGSARLAQGASRARARPALAAVPVFTQSRAPVERTAPTTAAPRVARVRLVEVRRTPAQVARVEQVEAELLPGVWVVRLEGRPLAVVASAAGWSSTAPSWHGPARGAGSSEPAGRVTGRGPRVDRRGEVAASIAPRVSDARPPARRAWDDERPATQTSPTATAAAAADAPGDAKAAGRRARAQREQGGARSTATRIPVVVDEPVHDPGAGSTAADSGVALPPPSRRSAPTRRPHPPRRRAAKSASPTRPLPASACSGTLCGCSHHGGGGLAVALPRHLERLRARARGGVGLKMSTRPRPTTASGCSSRDWSGVPGSRPAPPRWRTDPRPTWPGCRRRRRARRSRRPQRRPRRGRKPAPPPPATKLGDARPR